MSGEAAHEDYAAPGGNVLVNRHQDHHEDEDYGENQDQDHYQPRLGRRIRMGMLTGPS